MLRYTIQNKDGFSQISNVLYTKHNIAGGFLKTLNNYSHIV